MALTQPFENFMIPLENTADISGSYRVKVGNFCFTLILSEFKVSSLILQLGRCSIKIEYISLLTEHVQMEILSLSITIDLKQWNNPWALATYLACHLRTI